MSRKNDASEPEEDILHEDRFLSDEFKLQSLQNMAAYRVAISILNHSLSVLKHKLSKEETRSVDYIDVIQQYRWDEKYHDEMYKLVTTLGIPESVKIIIMISLREVYENVGFWIYYSADYISDGDLQSYGIHPISPSYCVWNPNGRIDNRRTAVNILRTHEFDEVQKFILMAKHCMEDELKAFPPDLLPPEFVKLVDFDENPVIYYWIRYLTKTLHEIPTENFNSIDVTMAANILRPKHIHRDVYWTAFDYFWNRLSSDDQVFVAKLVLSIEYFDYYFYRYNKGDFYSYYIEERLLSMMSWHQQQSLFYPTLDRSMLNFCIRLDSPESVFWAWKHSKNRMTVEQFSEIVALSLNENHEFENRMRLFMDIWNSAPSHFREHVFENMENNMIGYFFHSSIFPPTSVNFLREFFSQKSAHFWDKMMFNNAIDILAEIDDPHSITEFLNFCVPDEIRQKELKKLVFDSDRFKNKCVNTFIHKDLNLLNIQLKYYASDVNDVRKLKNWLVTCDTVRDHLHQIIFDDNKWNKVTTIVDDIYPNEPAIALKRKKNIISTFADLYLDPASASYPSFEYKDNLKKFFEILNQLQYSNEETKTLKQTFFNRIKKTIYDYELFSVKKCSKNNFQPFLSWCLDYDTELISRFKKSISLDIIFCKVFGTWHGNYRGYDRVYFRRAFSELDEFFRWCCPDLEEIKKYKLSKINNFQDIKIFKKFLRLKDYGHLDILLEWFFESDEVAIRKFKSEKLDCWQICDSNSTESEISLELIFFSF